MEDLIRDIERMLALLTKSKAYLKDDNECADIVTNQLKAFRDTAICMSKLSMAY